MQYKNWQNICANYSGENEKTTKDFLLKTINIQCIQIKVLLMNISQLSRKDEAVGTLSG